MSMLKFLMQIHSKKSNFEVFKHQNLNEHELSI